MTCILFNFKSGAQTFMRWDINKYRWTPGHIQAKQNISYMSAYMIGAYLCLFYGNINLLNFCKKQ